MSYFRFLPNVKYISEDDIGVIYELIQNTIISLTEQETKIVDELIDLNDINEVKSKYGKLATELIDKLIIDGLAGTFNSPVYTEAYIENCTWELRGFLEQPPKMKSLYIELTKECEAECRFCNEMSNKMVNNGCNSCIKWPEENELNYNMALDKYKYNHIIKSLMDITPQRIVFSGGNPTLEWDKLISITNIARKINETVEIIINTHGITLTELMLIQAKDLRISFCFSILGIDKDQYEKITKINNSMDKLMKNIKFCKSIGIDYNLNILIDKLNRHNIEELIKYSTIISSNEIIVTEIIEKYDKYLLSSAIKLDERIENFNLNTYTSNNKYNGCLNGTLAVTMDGFMKPCPMLDDYLCNLIEQDITVPFRNKDLDRFWRLTKNDIPKCKDCSYKYLCNDCSVIEIAMLKDSKINKSFCDKV